MIPLAAIAQHALDPAGPQAAHIADLWWLTFAICAIVFIAIVAAFLWAISHAPRADERTPADIAPLSDPEPRSRSVVIGAVGLSVVGLAVLLVASILTDRALATLDVKDALHIQVTAHQWWWDVHYDDPEPARVFNTANEIHIPVGRPVVISLASDDVIHSLWVPNLHGKKDLIPGHTITTQLRADKAGIYRGQCAEFCGLQHAFMAFQVTAEPPEAFAQWADAQRKPAPEPASARQKRGQELFLTGPCMMCHAIQGTPANGRHAPDLTHVASRATLAAGTLANTRANLAEWITEPGKSKPGVKMPSHPLVKEDLEALLDYMETLK